VFGEGSIKMTPLLYTRPESRFEEARIDWERTVRVVRPQERTRKVRKLLADACLLFFDKSHVKSKAP